MRLKLCLAGAALLLGTVGCEVETGYGGGYGAYGEYPSTYYGSGAYYPDYVSPQIYVGPYDRDHYWDRERHWERQRWHGDEDWDRR